VRSARAAAVAALGAAVLLMLGGCVAPAVSRPDPAPTPTPTQTFDNPDTGDLVDPVGAIADLTGFRCSSEHGVWGAKGALVNLHRSEQSYYVSVAVIRQAGSTVVGTRSVRVTVKPGVSKTIAFDSIATSRSRGLQCVPRVLRAAA
jgi:hypothetical protein